MIKKMHTAPTNLCHEPYLTEWHADLEEGIQIWVQAGIEGTNWVRLGDLFERSVLDLRTKINMSELL